MRRYCSECGGEPRWRAHIPGHGSALDRLACDWHLLRAAEVLANQTGEVLVTLL